MTSTSQAPPHPLIADPSPDRGLGELYTTRRSRFAAAEAEESRRYNWISLARVITFLGGISGFLLLKDTNSGVAVSILGGAVVLFFIQIAVHERVLQRREHLRRQRIVNEMELDRAARRLDRFDAGTEYLDPEHPYSGDLDLFGAGSLFQFVSRANTLLGKHRLADWLRFPAKLEEIRRRQTAVRELTPLLDWRQEFAARGLQAAESKAEPSAFLEWLDEPVFVVNRPALASLIRVTPLLAIGSILAGWLFASPAWLVAGFSIVFLQILLNLRFGSAIRRCHAGTSRLAKLFAAYVRMFQIIEAQPFAEAKTRELRQTLFTSAKPASAWIHRVSNLVHNLDLRYGMMHFPIDSLLLWDLRAVLHLEEWKRDAGTHVGAWFGVLAELEALASLAGLAFDHPDWTMPSLEDEALLFDGEALGHPLIPAERMVRNDFALAGRGQIAIISGSNMAGKSTFLRSVGVNAVLALAGGPACARKLRVSGLELYTSMRTQDSLGASASLFYAELRRLKGTIDAVASGRPVFFLLDEILKGTNSQDRHLGSDALMRQLQKHGGSGLIATHDLELGRLEHELRGHVRNFCFESEAQDGRLYFDYRLREGLCTSMNAVRLMQSMGIEV